METNSNLRSFRETVLERAQRDPQYRQALLTEAIDEYLSGDLEVSKIMFRDYLLADKNHEKGL